MHTMLTQLHPPALPVALLERMDAIRAAHAGTVHNIFLDARQLAGLAARPDSLTLVGDSSVFVLVPKHGAFYDILFMAASGDALRAALPPLADRLDMPARVSLVGAERACADLAEIWYLSGFRLGKKIARMHNLEDVKEIEKKLEEHQDLPWQAEFAVPGDEWAILDLLLTEFDPRSDNLPELADIADNIRKKQVFVIRDGARIVSVHYFTRKGAIAYGWYDITRKEYRKKLLYFSMLHFQYKFWKTQPEAKRSYSWRDTANTRLMALARACSQFSDGVYIYNLLYR